MEMTEERCIPSCITGVSHHNVLVQNLANYNFAVPYVLSKNVLDLGCGGGYGANLVKRMGASYVLGVDLSPEAIEYAKAHYHDNDSEFMVMDVGALALYKPFDVVCAFEVIEHVRDFRRLLSEVRRLLEPNGRFLLSTPNKKFSSPYSRRPINKFHIIEFYPSELLNVLREYFEDVRVLGVVSLKKERRFLRVINRLKLMGSPIVQYIPFSVRARAMSAVSSGESLLRPEDFVLSSENVDDCRWLWASCQKARAD